MHSVDRISGGGPILSRKYLGLGITAQKAAFQPPDDWRLLVLLGYSGAYIYTSLRVDIV